MLAMKCLLIGALMLSPMAALAQDASQIKARLAKAQEYEAKGFHPIDCFAGRVRIQGKPLSRQSFTVFRPTVEMKCCGEKIRSGTTDAHGHFFVEPLSEGEYVAQFTSKGVVYTTNFAVMSAYNIMWPSICESQFFSTRPVLCTGEHRR
jgi:hypothetical protein